MITDRSASFATPPALRITYPRQHNVTMLVGNTCASPSLIPRAAAGSILASMQVITMTWRAGGSGRPPLSKLATYWALASSNCFAADILVMKKGCADGGETGIIYLRWFRGPKVRGVKDYITCFSSEFCQVRTSSSAMPNHAILIGGDGLMAPVPILFPHIRRSGPRDKRARTGR